MHRAVIMRRNNKTITKTNKNGYDSKDNSLLLA